MKNIIGLLAICSIVLIGCVDREAQKQAKRTSDLYNDTTIPVSIELAKSKSLAEQLVLTGQIVTSEIATVGARIGGKIVAVYVKDGDQVSVGQVIARQDTASLSISLRQASAQASQARAALQQALSNKAIAPSKSASAVASAEAAVRSARAQLEKARNGARSEEIKQAESAVTSAKSAMETAKKEWERQQYMLKEGATSQQAVENAENQYRSALANYESSLENLRMRQSWTRPEDIRAAEESLRQAEEQVRTAKSQQRLDILYDQQVEAARANVRAADAQVDLARRNIADATITSPFSGRISGPTLQPGTYASPGTTVAKVVGSGGVYFEGQIPESNVNSVQVGDPVTVVLDSNREKQYSGTLLAIDPLGDEVGRLYKARIQIENPDNKVRPGMFARGTVLQNQIPNAVVVPSTAVIRDDDKAYVFVISNNKAKKVEVTLGITEGDHVQVKGITAGTPIAIKGQSLLVDGATVREETPQVSAEKK